ncbi:hypothetical protein [Nocardioides alcanivorans]|uniref:hypothetical protein n=1 Tax=Nocardioides alcanivorans TaxID=2897352 RepID=UPI001F1DB248|nr:hypothetical protein [Nocardioides alcanivorans]
MSHAQAEVSQPSDLNALILDARTAIPALVAEIVADIRASVSAYAGPEGGERQRVIALAVTKAAHQFLDTLAGPTPPDPQVAKLFQDMGFGELQEGHTLDPMRRALRIATRHSWRVLHRYASHHEFSAAFLGHVGDALLAYIDHLDREVERGHRLATVRGRGHPERVREHLIDALLLDVPNCEARLTELKAEAKSAGWTLPAEIVVLRVSHHGAFPEMGVRRQRPGQADDQARAADQRQPGRGGAGPPRQPSGPRTPRSR